MDPGPRPSELVVRVLGPLEVRRNGDPVPVASEMQRRVLAALAMADGGTVSVDGLVRALWGDEPPASARNSLQSHVARLRDTIGRADAIVTRPPGYALDPAVVAVDVRDFGDHLAGARSDHERDPATAVRRLEAAIGLWRGEAYADFADDLARDESVRLAEQRAQAEELLCRAQLAVGDVDGAVGTARTLTAREPHRGSAAVLLARSLAAAGRVPDALEALREHRRRLADDLGLDPPSQVAELEGELLRGDGAVPGSGAGTAADAMPGAQPTPPPRIGTATVGREDERRRVLEAVRRAPLVTLTGPGGVGKTRLAAVVAGDADRKAWVDLAPIRVAADVAPTVLDALGAVTTAGGTDRAAVDALAAFRGLVVVDNCEHLLGAVAELLDAALARSGPVRILATSRERLDVRGELVIPLRPLPVPDPDQATDRDPVVRLFADRVAALGGDPVPPADAARVAAAVDGLPLAVELAAARTATLPVAALLERLPADLGLLSGTRRRHGTRHQTLTQVIDWSHDLLGDDERILFRRLAIFAATFRLTDLERICTDGALPPSRLPVALASLVDASMVVRLGQDRYRLLEPLRVYAATRLAEGADGELVRDRQRDAVVALAVRADAEVSGPGEAEVLRELRFAFPDIRAVHARALDADDLATVARLVGPLARAAYLKARPHLLAWGEALAGEPADAVDPELRGRALAAAAAGAWMVGELDRAERLAAQADGLCRTTWSRIAVEEVTGDLHATRGDLAAAAAAYERLVAHARELAHPGLLAHGELGLALVHLYREDRAAAREQADASVRHAEESGAESVCAFAQYTLGEVLAPDDPEAALAALDRALALAVDGRIRLVEGLARTADVALRGRHGDPEEALRRYRDALVLWRDSGADGLLQTALRNLVILLARVGADRDAVTVHRMVERLATKPSFGAEARDVAAALAAVRERLGSSAAAEAESEAEGVDDLRDAADRALASVRDALARTGD